MNPNQISYATETAHWEKWWHGYAFGAFYIFPPEEIMQKVDALREKYDPKSARACRAHISLSEPLPHKITQAEWDALTEALQTIKRFRIHYGPIKPNPPYPGVTFAITPLDRFDELRRVIHATSIFEHVTLKRSKIVPHMTIAEFVTLERSYEIVEELDGKIPEGEFECTAIELAVPGNDFYFERMLTIPLG